MFQLIFIEKLQNFEGQFQPKNINKQLSYMQQQYELQELIHITQQGTNTQQIQQAQKVLFKVIMNPKFVKIIQPLLKGRSEQVMMGISILVKKVAECQVQQCQNYNSNNTFSRIHQIYELIQDEQIQLKYKVNIIEAYVLLYFKTRLYYDHKKMFTNIDYYFNSGKPSIASLMILCVSKYPLKLNIQNQLYSSMLNKLIVTNLSYFEQIISLSNQQINQNLVTQFQYMISTLHYLITSIDFMIFEDAADKIYSSNQLTHMFFIFSQKMKNIDNKMQNYIIQMMIKIINNIKMMKQKLQYQKIINSIRLFGIKCCNILSGLHQIQFLKDQFAKIKLINSLIQVNLLEYSLIKTQIVLNYLQIAFINKIAIYFKRQIQLTQLLCFLDQMCFETNSQCIEAQLSKLLHYLINKSVSIEQSHLSGFYDNLMGDKINEKQINQGLVISCLLSKTIMMSKLLLYKVENFYLRWYKYYLLWEQKSNNEIKFIFLKGVSIYLEDLFQSESAKQLHFLVIQKLFKTNIQQPQQEQIIHMLIHIVQTYFTFGYSYQYEQQKIQFMFSIYQTTLQSENITKLLLLTPILITMIEQYGQNLPKQSILQIMRKIIGKMLKYIEQLSAFDLSNIVKLIQKLFSHQKYCNDVDDIVDNLRLIVIKCNFFQVSLLFPLISNYIKRKYQIPSKYQSLIQSCQLSLKDLQTVSMINYILIYGDQKSQMHTRLIFKIINECISSIQNEQKLQLHRVILLHIAIYYHHQKMSNQIIQKIVLSSIQSIEHKQQFNFVKGKHKITLLLLLQYQNSKFRKILSDIESRYQAFNNQFKSKPLEQLVYFYLYKECNDYIVQYDILQFVRSQINISCRLQSQLQIKFANVSTLAIIINLSRLYKRKVNNHYQQLSESSNSQLDDQEDNIFLETTLEKEYRYMKTFLKNIVFPLPFSDFNVFDHFTKWWEIVNSRQETKKWFKQQIQVNLSQQSINCLNQMKNIVKFSGEYRKIVKKTNIIMKKHQNK